jgi:hypothetical protein
MELNLAKMMIRILLQQYNFQSLDFGRGLKMKIDKSLRKFKHIQGVKIEYI